MKSTVVERHFKKESSVFAKWREDTAGSIAQSAALDISMWKGHRFIKSAEEVSELFSSIVNMYYHFREKLRSKY